MKRLVALTVMGLVMAVSAYAFSTHFKTQTSYSISAVLDSTGDTVIFPNDSGGWTVASGNIEIGDCDEVRSLIGSIILDSAETSDGTPATHGYGLLDSAIIRFGTRLGHGGDAYTADIPLDSVNAGSLPCTLWISHIANDTLLKGELYIDYVIFDTSQIDSIETIGATHALRYHLIGRQ